jgi:lysophospholipase L1-like esterase
MRKPWWKRASFWTVIVILASPIAADLALRLALGLGTPVLYRNDPAAGYVADPSQHVVRLFCRNDINRFSMRSPPIKIPKPGGEYRILCIGDSVTYGTTFVDQSEIFTSLLDRDLPGLLHKPVEVLNASAGGWAPGNELGYLRSRGTFDADRVIFVLNTGDLTQIFAESPVGVSPGYPSQEPLCALTELFSRYLLPRLEHENSADAGSTAAAAPDIAHDTPQVLAILAKANKFVTAHGAKFLIVYTPAVGPDWAPFAPGLKMLKDWCKSNSVHLLDITPFVADLPVDQIYFPAGHIHFRPKGHAIIARAIADYLVSHVQQQSATASSKP